MALLVIVVAVAAVDGDSDGPVIVMVVVVVVVVMTVVATASVVAAFFLVAPWSTAPAGPMSLPSVRFGALALQHCRSSRLRPARGSRFHGMLLQARKENLSCDVAFAGEQPTSRRVLLRCLVRQGRLLPMFLK